MSPVSPAGLPAGTAVLTIPIAHGLLTDPAFFQKSSGLITTPSVSLFLSFLLQVKQMVLQITRRAGVGGEIIVKENIICTDKISEK